MVSDSDRYSYYTCGHMRTCAVYRCTTRTTTRKNEKNKCDDVTCR